MSRKTARLTVDHLAELPDPVRSCLFWELGPVDRARLDEQERIAEKESWLSAVLRDWGSCGRVVRVEDNPEDPHGLWPHRLAVEFDQPEPELEWVIGSERAPDRRSAQRD